jgi:hypothetical protein
MLSFITSLTGGIMVVAKFAAFSLKVKKSNKGEDVYINKKDENLFSKLDYVLLIAGVTIIFISYYLVV